MTGTAIWESPDCEIGLTAWTAKTIAPARHACKSQAV
jgi:hypothetical protein